VWRNHPRQNARGGSARRPVQLPSPAFEAVDNFQVPEKTQAGVEAWPLLNTTVMRSLSLIDIDATTSKIPLAQRADTYEQVRRTLDDALAELEREMDREEDRE
jgi:hypothetical protein